MKNILTFGEILVRLSSNQGKRLREANTLHVNYGGAEANVAVSLAQYGYRTSIFSRIPDHEISKGILHYLKGYDVNTNLIQLKGTRIGTYYLEVGAGNRSSKVIYDRAHTSITELTPEDLDYETIFKDQELLHVTGITPALSDNLVQVTECLFKEAKARGILISFDFNYRAKLWSKETAGQVFKRLLPYVDICSCAELDFIHLLGYEQESERLSYPERLTTYYKKLSEEYNNITVLFSTKRENLSASTNQLTGYFYTKGQLYKSPLFSIDHIIDRVGGGDAFVSGVLHGYLSKWNEQKIIDFATAASVLKHTILGDANIVTEEEVNNMLNNGSQINR